MHARNCEARLFRETETESNRTEKKGAVERRETGRKLGRITEKRAMNLLPSLDVDSV